jgi:hypothetical protein
MKFKWFVVLLVFSAVHGNCMAVFSPSPIPNMPSMDYQEPNILQTILHYIRGVDPALNKVNDLFPLIMRHVFNNTQLIDLKSLDKQQCLLKLNQYQELVEAKDQMVFTYRYVLEKNEHLLSKPSVQAQVESMDSLVVSERETLLFVFQFARSHH